MVIVMKEMQLIVEHSKELTSKLALMAVISQCKTITVEDDLTDFAFSENSGLHFQSSQQQLAQI